MLLSNIELSKSYISTRKKPKNLISQDDILFNHEYSYKVPSIGFKKIRNADVLGDTVFDKTNFTFYASHTHINGFFSLKQKLNYLKYYFTGFKKIDEAVWITQNWTWMYFHWMTDALTRLIALEGEVEKFPVLLPIAYKSYPYIVESLELLGYEYVWYTPTQRVRIKELLLPSHTASPGNYNGEILNRLRNRFVVPVGNSYRKIFISRSKAPQRFIANEDEVVALVLAFGFEVHIFEEYTLNKQVALMREATCLMGLHGAGLTNMLFMPPKGKVLEFRNKRDQHNNCYFSMASELDHSYYYLEGDGDTVHTASVNIHIDLIQLTNLLHLTL